MGVFWVLFMSAVDLPCILLSALTLHLILGTVWFSLTLFPEHGGTRTSLSLVRWMMSVRRTVMEAGLVRTAQPTQAAAVSVFLLPARASSLSQCSQKWVVWMSRLLICSVSSIHLVIFFFFNLFGISMWHAVLKLCSLWVSVYFCPRWWSLDFQLPSEQFNGPPVFFNMVK